MQHKYKLKSGSGGKNVINDNVYGSVTLQQRTSPPSLLQGSANTANANATVANLKPFFFFILEKPVWSSHLQPDDSGLSTGSTGAIRCHSDTDTKRNACVTL